MTIDDPADMMFFNFMKKWGEKKSGGSRFFLQPPPKY